jgi:hypothetical protein
MATNISRYASVVCYSVPNLCLCLTAGVVEELASDSYLLALFNGNINKSADGFVTFTNSQLTWPGGRKQVYDQGWYEEFIAKLKVAWSANPLGPSSYSRCPRLCELSGTAGTGKSIAALLLINAVSSAEWGEQPDILYIHRWEDYASRNLRTENDGHMHLLTRDGNQTRHFTFECEYGAAYVDALLAHRLDKRRKLFAIVDSMSPSRFLNVISSYAELHMCLYVASLGIRIQAMTYMQLDHVCWRFDDNWFFVTAVAKSEYLTFCRKCMPSESLDWLREMARLCDVEKRALSGHGGTDYVEEAEIEILGFIYDIFGGNLHYLMFLRTVPLPAGCQLYDGIVDCLRETAGSPTDAMKQAVLLVCAGMVYDALRRNCGSLLSLEAFSYTEFSSLFLREYFKWYNGEAVMLMGPSSPFMLQLLKRLFYLPDTPVFPPLIGEIRWWLYCRLMQEFHRHLVGDSAVSCKRAKIVDERVGDSGGLRIMQLSTIVLISYPCRCMCFTALGPGI